MEYLNIKHVYAGAAFEFLVLFARRLGGVGGQGHVLVFDFFSPGFSGRACSALSDRPMRCFSASTDSTFTSTSWPSLTTSPVRNTRPWASSEM